MAAVAVAIAAMHLSGRGGCSARALLGRECLFCGMTRDLFTLAGGGTNFRNALSPWVFAFAAAELVWRGAFAVLPAPRRVALADATIHAVAAAILLAANFAALAR